LRHGLAVEGARNRREADQLSSAHSSEVRPIQEQTQLGVLRNPPVEAERRLGISML
jgi:hypothetical protein